MIKRHVVNICISLAALCLLFCNAGINTNLINPTGKTIRERFNTPEGFERKEYKKNSYANYLRSFNLKPNGTKVYTYDGGLKQPDNVHQAVLDIDIGEKDLQQCADAVMRLRAEYLFANKLFDQIHFNFTNGNNASYEKYAQGYRFSLKSNAWVKNAKTDNSYKAFREYLDLVFNYAGSLSLSHELKPVELEDIEIGDVFIKGGSPGQAVIVVDLAYNSKTKEKIFMLAQSYMPAQNIHVLKNFSDTKMSPWYSAKFDEFLKTPEWTFTKAQLMRFKD